MLTISPTIQAGYGLQVIENARKGANTCVNCDPPLTIESLIASITDSQ